MSLAATLLLIAGVHAQDGTRPANTSKDPQRAVSRERPQQAQGLSPMAGSPQAQWDSIGQPFLPDTALASILLDRSQVPRIEEMDRRYAQEFRRLGTADRSDPRYQRLWTKRGEELRSILTPGQYERWRELNAGHLPAPQPVDMPVAKPDEKAVPMPTMPVDSTNDQMPVLKDSPPKQVPPSKR